MPIQFHSFHSDIGVFLENRVVDGVKSRRQVQKYQNYFLVSVDRTENIIKHTQKCCFSTVKASVCGLQLCQKIISKQVVYCLCGYNSFKDLGKKRYICDSTVTGKLVMMKRLLLYSWMQDSFLEGCRKHTGR